MVSEAFAQSLFKGVGRTQGIGRGGGVGWEGIDKPLEFVALQRRLACLTRDGGGQRAESFPSTSFCESCLWSTAANLVVTFPNSLSPC